MVPELAKTVRFLEAEELRLWLERIFHSAGAFRHIKSVAPRLVQVARSLETCGELTDACCDIVNTHSTARTMVSVIFSQERVLIIDRDGNRAVDIPRGRSHGESKARVYGEVARILGFDPVHPVVQ
jgi:hypothetical protein